MRELRQAKRVRSLYLHIPFCLSKCLYCSFSSFPNMSEHHHRYVQALKSHIRTSCPETNTKSLETLFIGGGTPTVLEAEKLAEIIAVCRDTYRFSDDIEISIEANPGTIDISKLKVLGDAGVNRLSIGVQSFNDTDLQGLGRAHRSDISIQALEYAREAGFKNISLDLMYGLPGQSTDSWQKNLEQAVALGPHHLSCYQLTIEEGTDFYNRYPTDSLELPDDRTIIAMEQATRKYLSAHGIGQYEISNYARPGYECRHNIGYWLNEEFIGCGAGAAGFFNGRRYKVITDPLRYCSAIENGEDVIEDSEVLSAEASFRETVVMGLRLLKGVDRRRLYDRYGLTVDELYGSIVKELAGKGLLEENEDYLRLTAQGRCFANQVMAELV